MYGCNLFLRARTKESAWQTRGVHVGNVCKRPVRLILDSLPAHKTRIVRDYVESTQGRLSLHFLPGYAPELNPDELVWSHIKRTGTARRPLQQGEELVGRIDQQLADVLDDPKLVRSFFEAPSVAYIRDC